MDPSCIRDSEHRAEIPRVLNAVQQAMKEVITRYDLKDSHSTIELKEKENKLELHSKDEFKLKAVVEILQGKLVKRQVPLKGLNYGTITQAAGSTVRQEVTLQQGIPVEKAREILRTLRVLNRMPRATQRHDQLRRGVEPLLAQSVADCHEVRIPHTC